jgi:hypothetical protein
MPGFGAYTGKKWYNSDSEEQDEHDDPPLPATTSNTQEVPVSIARTSKRPREAEPRSDSKLTEPIKDDKSPDDDKEHLGTGKMSSEPDSLELPDHFDFRPDTSSSGSNPADYEPIPNERNEYYPKRCIDEFEDLDDYTKAYVQYRIAGGRMKFKESDTGSEQHYTRFPGIELDEVGNWHEDRNNVAPCEWSMSSNEYVKWFHSTHPKPVDIRQATRF